MMKEYQCLTLLSVVQTSSKPFTVPKKPPEINLKVPIYR